MYYLRDKKETFLRHSYLAIVGCLGGHALSSVGEDQSGVEFRVDWWLVSCKVFLLASGNRHCSWLCVSSRECSLVGFSFLSLRLVFSSGRTEPQRAQSLELSALCSAVLLRTLSCQLWLP